MNLNKVTDRISFYPFEKERDRPILGYIRGDKWSLAVDAGHSEAHTKDHITALLSPEESSDSSRHMPVYPLPAPEVLFPSRSG